MQQQNSSSLHFQHNHILPPDKLCKILNLPFTPPILTMGGDVARLGTDHNVWWIKFGRFIIGYIRYSGVDPIVGAKLVSNYIFDLEERGWIFTSINVDVIGPGGTMVDHWYNNESDRYKNLVYGINVSYASTNPKRFRNIRAELGWNLRMLFRQRELVFIDTKNFGKEIGIPSETGSILERLQEQATTIQYGADEHRGGVIYIESKDEYKKRMENKSPDEFDALVLTFNENHIGAEKRYFGNALRALGSRSITSR